MTKEKKLKDLKVGMEIHNQEIENLHFEIEVAQQLIEEHEQKYESLYREYIKLRK